MSAALVMGTGAAAGELKDGDGTAFSQRIHNVATEVTVEQAQTRTPQSAKRADRCE